MLNSTRFWVTALCFCLLAGGADAAGRQPAKGKKAEDAAVKKTTQGPKKGKSAKKTGKGQKEEAEHKEPQKPAADGTVQTEEELNELLMQAAERLERNYPRIRKAAKSVGAEIYRCDETGVSTRENFQRGYAPKGQTPLLSVTSVVSCRISMISAVSCRGALSFHVYSGALNVRRFLRFAQPWSMTAHREKQCLSWITCGCTTPSWCEYGWQGTARR